MSLVARWALFTAVLSPLALIGGWVVAGALQPSGTYDPVRQTISFLAGGGARDRWVMSLGLFTIGACNIATAAGLRAIRPASRVLLGLAGATAVGVALFPEPVHGSAATHVAFATTSLILLALWPASVAGGRRTGAPVRGSRVLGPAVSRCVAGGCLTLLAWVFIAGHGAGGLGVAERVATAAENLWPLAVVLALRSRADSRGAVALRGCRRE